MRRAAALAAAGGAAGVLGAWAAAPAGVEYESRVAVTTTDVAGRVVRAPPLLARTRAVGSRARVDITAGNDDIRAGDFILTADGGRTLTVVSPARRRYTIIAPSTLGDQLAAELRGKAAVSDASVVVHRPAAGVDEPTAAPLTERVRTSRAYTLRLRVFRIRNVVLEVQETSDYWVNPTLRTVPNPLATYLIAAADAPTYADASFAARVRDASTVVAGAFPVRWVHRSVTRRKGDRTETVTALDVGPVRRAEVDTALFAVPAGYARRAPE